MSPKFPKIGTRLLLILTILLGLAHGGDLKQLDAERTFRAAMSFLQPDRDRAIFSVYRARDGTTWLVGVDWGETPMDDVWFARRLRSTGDLLDKDIVLSPTRQLASAWPGAIVGTGPDGSLILDQEYAMGMRERLVKIGLNGAVEKRDVPRHAPDEVFVDRDGIAHILPDGGREGPNYVQVNVNARGMPVVRTLSYDSPYKQYASVPEYLRWEYGEAGKRLPFGLDFLSEGRGRMLVAKATFAPSDTCFHLYRIDTKTLAVIDSGTADLRRDVYRVWSGPTIGRTTIVPAGESGYWVFTLTSNKEYWRAFMPVSDTPAPTVVAYRFSRDLKAVHPTHAVRVEAKPFASAKQDGVVSVTSASRQIPKYELGTRAMLTKLKLDFAAFDSDGELYTQTYEDSLTSRPMH